MPELALKRVCRHCLPHPQMLLLPFVLLLVLLVLVMVTLVVTTTMVMTVRMVRMILMAEVMMMVKMAAVPPAPRPPPAAASACARTHPATPDLALPHSHTARARRQPTWPAQTHAHQPPPCRC